MSPDRIHGGHVDVALGHDHAPLQLDLPGGPDEGAAGVPSRSPDWRITLLIPRRRASVTEISTWVSFRQGPRITTFRTVLSDRRR